MYNKLCVLLLASILSLQVPAYAISASVGWQDSRGAVASSGTYQLDDSTSFNLHTNLGPGGLYEESRSDGMGKNVLKDTIAGNGYAVKNVLSSSGSLCASSSAAASVEGAIITQNTAISGDAGFISSSTRSRENSMLVAGGFSGDDGSLKSQLTSSAADRALTKGSASVSGIDCYNDEVSQTVASGDLLMSVNGLYVNQNRGLGNVGWVALNEEKGSYMPDMSGSQVSYQTLNDPNSYKLVGWRWNDNPSIQLYMKTDANFKMTGLTVDQANRAIYDAADTWDGVTSQKLFKNGVICSQSLSADKSDDKNVVAWRYDTSNALAYTRTYYLFDKVTGYNGGSYFKATESDITFNTAYSWTTDGRSYPAYPNTYDVQTAALHELGHTVGLDDIYNSAQFSWDKAQIMNSYSGLKRTLGAGDINGVKQLYGP